MEAVDREVLVLHDGKNFRQIQHREYIEVLLGQPDDVQAAHHRVHDFLRENERTDARAVYEIHVRKVDDDLVVPEAHERFDAHFKQRRRHRVEIPAYVEDHNVVRVALPDLEVHRAALPEIRASYFPILLY